MKIAFVQDQDPMVFGGGAQLNDRAMIVEGLRRGHDLQIIVPGENEAEFGTPDLAIISNDTALHTGFFDKLIASSVPYAFFVHDYVHLCRHRLYYPMEERCKTLCFLRDRWRPYLEGSKLIVWLSPLHRWAWTWAYPTLKQHPYALIPSAIDPKAFFDLGNERLGVIAVNSDATFKGWPLVRQWALDHPAVPITLVGGSRSDMPKNMTALGAVPYHQMNELYNQHQYFLHLPDRIMPFDRSCAEAYLAGCQVIGNRNVGALSWPWFKKGREEVRRQLALAPKHFWKAMEGVL